MRVLVVIGTRPEAIKMAPVIRELLRREDSIEVRVCLTAQHRELLDQVIRLFTLPVDHDLDVMAPDQSITQVTTSVLTGLGRVLAAARPEIVLVHGDTTTSFAAALAAFYQKIPVGHVEAGLRTYTRYSPFPEEMNRRLCDALCTYHYAPTAGARENLLREHLLPEHIVVTGNTVIDALLHTAAQPCTFTDPVLEGLGRERRLLLVTAHRRESFGAPFRAICTAIRDLVARHEDLEVVYPVHPNPQVQRTVYEMLAGIERVHLVEPLEYLPFVHLMKKSHLILTDSGGIQEEAPSLRKPVLVMREVTERPEAVAAGVVQLVGVAYDAIVKGVERLLGDEGAYRRMASGANPYGDGHASARIAEHLAGLQ
ncbi:MAG: UDP-N-acetylglucosamine 2-epimerase (non-hydrolyzing) [Candidatus Hydrogenedentes bacterium]|nr:UDP-N-acetylglucosamine 2-epimerase (non-hydrolyzing) [Candidatus Hydrogenedentota bacterium]